MMILTARTKVDESRILKSLRVWCAWEIKRWCFSNDEITGSNDYELGKWIEIKYLGWDNASARIGSNG